MTFDLTKSLQILERTPRVLATLLNDLDVEWTQHNDGGGGPAGIGGAESGPAAAA